MGKHFVLTISREFGAEGHGNRKSTFRTSGSKAL